MKKRISFGKIAFVGNRKINEVEVVLELNETDDGPVFSASCNVWNSRHSDIVAGGQCFETLNGYFKDNELFNEIVSLWKRNHLNELTPGTPEQMECIRIHKDEINEADGWYTKELNLLKKYNLDVVKYKGKPYKYGSEWIYRPIPEPDLNRIKEIINS